MASAWRRANGPIGIDLSEDTVRVVQVAQRRGGLRLVAAGQATGPGPDGPADLLADAVRDAVDRAGAHGADCVALVPTAHAQARNLRLPDVPDTELDAAVRFEAQSSLGGGTVQHFDAGRVGAGADARREVVALAVPDAHADRWLRALTLAKLRPRAIDAAPAALARTLHAAGRLDPAPAAEPGADASPATAGVLELGRNYAAAHFVQRDRVLFSKSLPALDTQDLDPGPATPLIREFALCLRYLLVTFRGQQPSHLYATGAAEDREPWLRALAAHTGLDTQPFAGLGQNLANTGRGWDGAAAAQWALALGAALRPAHPVSGAAA
ncbi:MAG: hypothetical protein AAGA57_01890 [Planctomycetota bacterium]